MSNKIQCDLLLSGGIVITVDDSRQLFDPGAVAIQGDKIVAVGHEADFGEYEPTRRVDCRGKMITPGFVDCHNHLFQTLARGIGDGMTLWPWLSQFMYP